MIKVLQVVQSYYPAFIYGGPIFSIHYACLALARRGVEIEVATTNANGAGKLEVETTKSVKFQPNYNVHYYDDTVISRYSWDFTRHLWSKLKQTDIVHLQDVFSTYAAWTLLLASLTKRPLLVSARGTFTPWGLKVRRPWLKKLWLALLVRPLTGDADRVAWHATSGLERAEILKQFPKAKVYVVANGIDCAAFDNVAPLSRTDYLRKFFPNACVGTRSVKVLVGLGRLHAKKSFDVVIRAIHQLADTQPDTVLLIAGADDGERSTLTELITELGLTSRVVLVGEVTGDDKIIFLKGADLFVFPSQGENFGMVALEALAAGTPVIASRNTPWAELETTGAGRCVENEPESFAGAIDQLLRRDMINMRNKAREHSSRFDLATIAADFERIYLELIHDQ